MIVKDRVRQTSSTTGQGTLSMSGGAIAGFSKFSQAFSSDTPTFYVIEEGSNWEVGMGTFYSSTDLLTRDVVLASSDGLNKINCAGSQFVFITLPAGKAIYADSGNMVNATGVNLGVSGIVFSDSTSQTTAAVSMPGATGVLIDANTSEYFYAHDQCGCHGSQGHCRARWSFG